MSDNFIKHVANKHYKEWHDQEYHAWWHNFYQKQLKCKKVVWGRVGKELKEFMPFEQFCDWVEVNQTSPSTYEIKVQDAEPIYMQKDWFKTKFKCGSTRGGSKIFPKFLPALGYAYNTSGNNT